MIIMKNSIYYIVLCSFGILVYLTSISIFPPLTWIYAIDESLISNSSENNNVFNDIDNTTVNEFRENSNFINYINSFHGFNISIQYPDEWIYQGWPISSYDTIFSIANIFPSDSNPEETNFEIGMEELENQISLDRYTKDILEYYKNNYMNFSLLSYNIDNITLSERQAYEMIYTSTIDGIDYKTYEIGAIDNITKRAYYIIFNTKELSYDKLNYIVQKMITSFKFNFINATTTINGSKSNVPIANAGSDQEAFTIITKTGFDVIKDIKREKVILDGSKSKDSLGGNNLLYLWKQINGPVVILNNSTTAYPSFYTPIVENEYVTLTFELVVKDNKTSMKSKPENVNVIVYNSGQAGFSDEIFDVALLSNLPQNSREEIVNKFSEYSTDSFQPILKEFEYFKEIFCKYDDTSNNDFCDVNRKSLFNNLTANPSKHIIYYDWLPIENESDIREYSILMLAFADNKGYPANNIDYNIIINGTDNIYKSSGYTSTSYDMKIIDMNKFILKPSNNYMWMNITKFNNSPTIETTSPISLSIYNGAFVNDFTLYK